MHVGKAEIGYWIDQGWLEAVRKDQGRRTCYNISPEALQFNQFCYVPKHTVGNNFSRCARRNESRRRTNLQLHSTVEAQEADA